MPRAHKMKTLFLTASITFLILFTTQNIDAVCCFPYNMNYYVDPITGDFVINGELVNDSYRQEPFGNASYQFVFLDKDNNTILEKDILITDILPIKDVVVIPLAATFPFQIMLSDIDPKTIQQISNFQTGTTNLDYFGWKPADLVISSNELISVGTIHGRNGDVFVKWKISGNITNTHSEKTENVYVVASLRDKDDGILGVAGYSGDAIQPITLNGFETKDFVLFALVPASKTPSSVNLYAESDDSSMVFPYYKPIIMRDAMNYEEKNTANPKKPIVISANITNISREDIDFNWIIQIKKSPKSISEGDISEYPKSKIAFIKSISGHVNAQRSTKLEYSWTPQSNGIYFYEMYVWDISNAKASSYPFKQGFLTNNWLIVNSNLNSVTNQIKSGIPLSEVQCRGGLEPAHKTSNGNLVCVKPETKQKLIERGWALNAIANNVHADEQTIILDEGIDDLDSGTSFNPIYKKILDTNNTITWYNAKQKPVQLVSDENYFNVTIQPQESFSFVYDTAGIHLYHDPINWKRGTVFVSTKEIESSNLSPAKLLEKNQAEIAKTIMQAAITSDEITEMRLDNTMLSAYVTQRGGDIIIPKSLCKLCTNSDYRPIEYRFGMTKPLFYPKSADDGVVFAKEFMSKIGYVMDGTEWIDSTDYGSYVKTAIQQRVQGWIIPNHIADFVFFKDNTSITLGRWYDDVTSYQFKLSQDDAKKIAKNYMQEEVEKNPSLQKFQYEFQEISDAQVMIIDDKVVYVVPVSFKSSLQQKFENGHCGGPEYFTGMTIIEGKTGSVLGWDHSICM